MSKPARNLTDQELVDHFGSGTEERQYMTVASQSANFVVFKVAGHKYWSNVMDPSAYARVRYILAARGDTWLRYSGTREWEGRISKKIIREALRRSELTKEVYTGDLDAPMREECDQV